jgi:hypothetical protein
VDIRNYVGPVEQYVLGAVVEARAAEILDAASAMQDTPHRAVENQDASLKGVQKGLLSYLAIGHGQERVSFTSVAFRKMAPGLWSFVDRNH